MFDESIYLRNGKTMNEMAKEYLILEEKLHHDAKTNADQYPTPSKMAKMLGIAIDEAIELKSYAHEVLGEDEREKIEASAMEFIDVRAFL